MMCSCPPGYVDSISNPANLLPGTPAHRVIFQYISSSNECCQLPIVALCPVNVQPCNRRLLNFREGIVVCDGTRLRRCAGDVVGNVSIGACNKLQHFQVERSVRMLPSLLQLCCLRCFDGWWHTCREGNETLFGVTFVDDTAQLTNGNLIMGWDFGSPVVRCPPFVGCGRAFSSFACVVAV
jgi:hypothetical protein